MICYVKQDNEFIESKFENMKAGDVFKLKNDNEDDFFINEDGESQWTAISDAFKTEDGEWVVKIGANESNIEENED